MASEVRSVARNVNTNRKRVESTTSARVFSERQLDAARKKFAVGLAQSIDVLIAQRDLATARFNELSSIIDYVKSLVELETVQEGGTGSVALGGRPSARRRNGVAGPPAGTTMRACSRHASASPSSRRTRRRGSTPRWPRSRGPTRSSSSTPAAPTPPPTSPAGPPTGSSSRAGPASPSRRTAPPPWRRTTGSSRSTPTSRSRRRSADEIRALLAGGPRAAGYRMPRVTRAFGRELRATDWYPDWQLRLYDRRAGRWDETRTVHESVRVDGEVAHAPRRAAARRLSRSLRASPEDRSLHDARRRGQRRAAAGTRRCSPSPSIRRSPSSATTSCAAASPPAPPAWWSRR